MQMLLSARQTRRRTSVWGSAKVSFGCGVLGRFQPNGTVCAEWAVMLADSMVSPSVPCKCAGSSGPRFARRCAQVVCLTLLACPLFPQAPLPRAFDSWGSGGFLEG